MKSDFNKHVIPGVLYKYPLIIKVLHFWNGIILLRNAHVKRRLKRILNAKKMNVLDAGCGDGQHLLWMNKKFPQHNYHAIDISPDNVNFCNHSLQTDKCKRADLENFKFTQKFDLIIVVSVLQYVPNDKIAIDNLCKHLKPEGELFLYSSVKNKTVFPFFDKLLNTFPHYEKAQNKQREYTTESINSLIEKSDLKIKTSKHTIGVLGKITQEYYTLFIALFGKMRSTIMKIIVLVIFLYPALPILLLLNVIDYHSSGKNGKGILLQINNDTLN